jgi:hypothetical protein
MIDPNKILPWPLLGLAAFVTGHLWILPVGMFLAVFAASQYKDTDLNKYDDYDDDFNDEEWEDDDDDLDN